VQAVQGGYNNILFDNNTIKKGEIRMMVQGSVYNRNHNLVISNNIIGSDVLPIISPGGHRR